MNLAVGIVAGLALSTAAWAVGQFFLAGARASEESEGRGQTFLALFLGALALTCGYALFKTGGDTVLTFSLPFLAAFLARPRLAAARSQLRWFGLFLLVELAWIVLCWGFFGGSERAYEAHGDAISYAQNVRAVETFGVENGALARMWVSPDYRVNRPYHYVDLWMSAIVAKASPLSPLEATTLVVQPTLLALACFGTFCLTRSWICAGLLPIAVGVAAPVRLFGSTWLFGYALPWLMYPLTLISRPKLAITLSFFLAAFLLLRGRGSPKRALSLVLLSAIATPTMWPGAFVGLCATCLLWKRDKTLSGREAGLLLLTSVGLALALVGFYANWLAPANAQASGTAARTATLAAIGLVKGMTYLLPNLALLGLLWKANPAPFRCLGYREVSLIGCCWLGGVLGLMLFQGRPDGFQVLTEPFYSLLSLLISLGTAGLLSLLKPATPGKGVAAGLTLAWLLFSWTQHFVPFYRGAPKEWSRDFQAQVQQMLGSEGTVWVAQLCSTEAIEGYTEPRLQGGLAAHSLGGQLLWLKRPEVNLINISDPFVRLSDDPEIQRFQATTLSRQPLTNFAREHSLPTDETAILALLKARQIRFVVMDAHHKEVPSWLAPSVELTLQDPASGQRFLRLKPW